MSSINGLGGISPLQPNQSVNKTTAPAAEANTGTVSDRLELSGASHLLQALKTNDVRTDKVASIKSQIDDGSYDADGSKLDAAVGNLLNDL
jgi:flagellar biosynthesis anti-sigma factor FlgM